MSDQITHLDSVTIMNPHPVTDTKLREYAEKDNKFAKDVRTALEKSGFAFVLDPDLDGEGHALSLTDGKIDLEVSLNEDSMTFITGNGTETVKSIPSGVFDLYKSLNDS